MKDKMNCLRAVQAADFAVLETKLYLDTHPCDKAALEAMRRYEAQAAAVREEYETRYGSLKGSAEKCDRWAWIDDPWPWNFS